MKRTIITHFDELRDSNCINGHSNITYFDKIMTKLMKKTIAIHFDKLRDQWLRDHCSNLIKVEGPLLQFTLYPKKDCLFNHHG